MRFFYMRVFTAVLRVLSLRTSTCEPGTAEIHQHWCSMEHGNDLEGFVNYRLLGLSHSVDAGWA